VHAVHIPYKGGAPAMTALLGGEVDFSFAVALTAMPMIKAKRVRALAVTTFRRSSSFPDLPTMDSVYPGFESDNWYGMFLHEAMYLEPVMRDIEKFLENSQENVTGNVIVRLIPYTFQLVGIESDHDLMKSEFGQYGEMNKGWTAEDAKGFTKILANQLKIFHSVNK
jgi:hypothetical protein